LLIGSLYRFRNKLRLCIVNHVANLRKQPENAVRYFFMEADSLAFDIHDTILGARHDYDGHNQVSIPARHRQGPRHHDSTILVFRTDLPRPQRHSTGEAVGEKTSL
jgi:hypothetical protein